MQYWFLSQHCSLPLPSLVTFPCHSQIIISSSDSVFSIRTVTCCHMVSFVAYLFLYPSSGRYTSNQNLHNLNLKWALQIVLFPILIHKISCPHFCPQILLSAKKRSVDKKTSKMSHNMNSMSTFLVIHGGR